ncbi:hypothetical protein [Paraburkholderia xenovorans]|uniref:hypothetical protein n=1 Tax=Paraburkholderia xenovorans TaxID=36873 RepID=UPI0038B7A3EC
MQRFDTGIHKKHIDTPTFEAGAQSGDLLGIRDIDSLYFERASGRFRGMPKLICRGRPVAMTR